MQLKFVWSICFMLLWSMVGHYSYYFPPFQLNLNLQDSLRPFEGSEPAPVIG